MIERKVKNKLYPVLTMLTGFISFLISGIFIGLISMRINEGLMLILGVPIGSVLMLFLLHKLNKDKTLVVIIWSELGGFAGFITGFTAGTVAGGIIGLIFPSLSDMSKTQSQIIPNIFALASADAIFGAFITRLIYGRKSISFFALVCGIASIPFGLLLSMPVKITLISFDQNLLFSLISFGTTTGLSIGLYSLLIEKSS